MESEMKLNIKAEVEGFGDAETFTIDHEVAETIGNLIKSNLRNRYTDITNDTELDVLTIEPPNRVLVHFREEEADYDITD